jgi:glycosyltransferase involved in cell wall biosynthesis
MDAMIIIDASPAVHHKAGLGRYTEDLLAALTTSPAQRADYTVFYHDAAVAKPSAMVRALPGLTTPQTPYPWRLRALLAQLLNMSQDALLAPLIQNPKSQIQNLFHATEHLLPRFKQVLTVFTLHDLIFRFYREYHLPRNWMYLQLAMPLFLRRADAIICVSEHTRRDAQRLYRLPDHKLHVIPEGVHLRFRRVTDRTALQRVRERYHLPPRFILAVGTIEPRKNLVTLFEAYAQLCADRAMDDLRVVVAGKQGWLVESSLRAVHERGLTGRVTFTGYVDDDDLPALYSQAQAFAFPSVYEGFGLPPLEALACGVPTVCSDASSLPEVMSDAALLAPPLDARAWMLALGRVLSDADLRRDLSARGPQQAARFTWDAAARQTRALYDTVLHTP